MSASPRLSEFEIHKAIANDYIASHPTTLLSSTPDMTSSTSRRKAVEKGYQKGFPDIFIGDPRVRRTRKGRKMYIRVCPGMFHEVKTPHVPAYVDSRTKKKVPRRAGGALSKEQRVVREAVQNRGYAFSVPRSAEEARATTEEYEKHWEPLYKGYIIVDFDARTVTLPPAPRGQPILPRAKIKKKKRRTTAVKRRRAAPAKRRRRSSRRRGEPKPKKRRVSSRS